MLDFSLQDAMVTDWRDRLETSIKDDGRSLRDISLAAGLSHGYLHGILRDGKEPTIDRFSRICKAMGVSLPYVLLGVDVSESTLALIKEIERGGPRRDAILALLSGL